jgi:hypothetical protein
VPQDLVAVFGAESAHAAVAGVLRLNLQSDPLMEGEDLADRQVRSGGDSWNCNDSSDLEIAVI